MNGLDTDAFVPFADMLNHSIPKQTTWRYSEKELGFIVEAYENISIGSQIHYSYGSKCNSSFFLNYGFISVPNEANEVPIMASIQCENDPDGYDAKLELISGF
jgi:histone-lysine N-methyltransferase SETD3